MDKAKMIGYLQDKLQQVDEENFNFEVWQGGVIRMLNQALGINNALSRQVQQLSYSYTMSYEELYPKKIIDWSATKKQLKAVLGEVTDQLKFMSEKELAATAGNSEAAAVIEAIQFALQNNLTGHQLSQVREKATGVKKEEQLKAVRMVLEDFDIEVVRAILSEILATQEFWEKN